MGFPAVSASLDPGSDPSGLSWLGKWWEATGARTRRKELLSKPNRHRVPGVRIAMGVCGEGGFNELTLGFLKIALGGKITANFHAQPCWMVFLLEPVRALTKHSQPIGGCTQSLRDAEFTSSAGVGVIVCPTHAPWLRSAGIKSVPAIAEL